MNLTYVNRRFLDYRVPVLAALDRLVGQRLHVIYSSDAMPSRVQKKIKDALEERAIGLKGEWKYGDLGSGQMANKQLTLHFQPGLYSKLVETNPDVVIGEGFFKWTIAALACKAIRRIPLVVCYERTAHTERNAQWYRRLYRKSVLSLVDAVCCNGSLSADYMMSLGVTRNRITQGHMAADTEGLTDTLKVITEAETEMLRHKLNAVGTTFVYVGRMISLKGVRELVIAWRQFEKIHPAAANLIMVGDGPELAALKKYCDDFQLQHVHITGAIDYDEIAIYYAAADALIIPTLEDNWSLVVPEAMTCGLPILCSKYNGCWPELVATGENGWVFDPFDPADIVHALELAIEHKSDLGRMGNKSLEIVKNFTPENAALSILDACHIAFDRQKNKIRKN